MAPAMHIQIAPSPCMFFFFQNQKDRKSMQEKQKENEVCIIFFEWLYTCINFIIFEEINFPQSSHTKHLDVVTVSQENLQCSLANVRYSTYMAWLSLPTFVSCAITHYANAHFVSIDPNALTKNSIHILRSETKPPRL